MTTKVDTPPLAPLVVLSHELDRTKRHSIDVQHSLGTVIQDQQKNLFDLTLQNADLTEKLKQKTQEAQTQKQKADAADEELKPFREITDKKTTLTFLLAEEVRLKEEEYQNIRRSWSHHLDKIEQSNFWGILPLAFYPATVIEEGYRNNPATKELKNVRAEIERLKKELKKHQDELFGILNQ